VPFLSLLQVTVETSYISNVLGRSQSQVQGHAVQYVTCS